MVRASRIPKCKVSRTVELQGTGVHTQIRVVGMHLGARWVRVGMPGRDEEGQAEQKTKGAGGEGLGECQREGHRPPRGAQGDHAATLVVP